jgi:hypothetical protein
MNTNKNLVEFAVGNTLGSSSIYKHKKYGFYRAVVIETNDPLNMNRIRILCPELHDNIPESSPWARPAPIIGGHGASYFVAPSIDDIVWIGFEKGDPEAPLYFGFANPTKRGMYAFQQIHRETSPILDVDAKIDRRLTSIEKTDSKYLPKDGRPMKTGYVDSYGNSDFSSAVGYFPASHAIRSMVSDATGNEASELQKRYRSPEINNPDLKYMLRSTKYGHIQLMSDQGYWWYKDPNNDDGLGEFTGDHEKDFRYEARRWINMQRMVSEDNPSGEDRRRQLFMTRYGHLIDMRDVGWGQVGPISSKSRSGEHGPPRHISNEYRRDQRFIRMRTKGGMYFIMGDRGFHPAEDKFVRRNLVDDMRQQDQDLERYWGGDKDARFAGLMTRYGWKMILDDRGSDPRNADKRERPRGLGMILKGRRRPGTGSEDSTSSLGKQRGFFFQIVEKDDLNSLMMGSPMGHSFEMSDKYQYMMMSSSMGRKWSEKWQGFKRHEYNLRPMMSRNPERNSHHLKIDHANEYIRFKTRGGRGPRPILADTGSGSDDNSTGVRKRELQQGFEARDGSGGDGPWVEVVDAQHRGLWMSKDQQLLIIRGKKRKKLYIWINDRSNEVNIYNGESNGRTKVHSKGHIELKADKSITIEAGGALNLKGRRIQLETENGGKMLMTKNIFTNVIMHAERFRGQFPGVMPGPGAGNPSIADIQEIESLENVSVPEKIEPSDRGKTYNGPFSGLNRQDMDPRIEDMQT